MQADSIPQRHGVVGQFVVMDMGVNCSIYGFSEVKIVFNWPFGKDYSCTGNCQCKTFYSCFVSSGGDSVGLS